MNPPVVGEDDREMEEVQGFFARYMFPETLEAFLEEKARTFRRTNHSSTENPSWVCVTCKKTFSKKSTAKRHCETAHAVLPAAAEAAAATTVEECPECYQCFEDKSKLLDHIHCIHAPPAAITAVSQQRTSKRLKTVTHDEHVDIVLPSGAVVCRAPSSTAAPAPSSPPRACCTPRIVENSCCGQDNHMRVQHDDHEDVLVCGTLRHFNTTSNVWEDHGELWSLEHDLDFLMEMGDTTGSTVVALPQGSLLFPGATQQSADSQAISTVLEAMNACNSATVPAQPHSHSHNHSHHL